jgi:hypothetical protein
MIPQVERKLNVVSGVTKRSLVLDVPQYLTAAEYILVSGGVHL